MTSCLEFWIKYCRHLKPELSGKSIFTQRLNAVRTTCEFSKCLGKQIASLRLQSRKETILPHHLFLRLTGGRRWLSGPGPTGCPGDRRAQFPRRPAGSHCGPTDAHPGQAGALGSGRLQPCAPVETPGRSAAAARPPGAAADAEVSKFRQFVFDSISQGLHLAFPRSCPAPPSGRPWVPAVPAVHRLPGVGASICCRPLGWHERVVPFVGERAGGWGRGFDRGYGSAWSSGSAALVRTAVRWWKELLPFLRCVVLIFFISARL